MKVKLSVSSENAALHTVLWVGNGILAQATGESLLRFLDLLDLENLADLEALPLVSNFKMVFSDFIDHHLLSMRLRSP